MPHPLGLITLLTDFGDRDSFVASMKGVILTINPHATIIDLSHHVPSHSVEDAAYLLRSSYRYFPEGTVHVAVVDPGVGSARRPLIAKNERDFFLAPDNGLLTHILAESSETEVREIENKTYRLISPGRTFDGRDLFAPAASDCADYKRPRVGSRRTGGDHRRRPDGAPRRRAVRARG